jgi:type III pantothenate kinase
MAEAELLTIDIGNSTIDSWRRPQRRSRCSSAAPDEHQIAELAHGAGRCIVASVVPSALAAVERTLAGLGRRAEVAGRELRCPLAIDYDRPESLGADRWLQALAAHHRHGAAVTIDCGSATTVNVVDARGVFRGGAIAPGLEALVAGMRFNTPLLPAAELDAPVAMPARSSAAAVTAGVLLGFAGLVDRLATDGRAVLGDGAPVLLTGGNAARVWPLLRSPVDLVPDLVHEGLQLLASSP